MNIGTSSGFFRTVKTLSHPHVSSTQSKYFFDSIRQCSRTFCFYLVFLFSKSWCGSNRRGGKGRCRSFYPCFINEKAGSLAYKSGKNNLLTSNQEARPEATLFEPEHCCWCTNWKISGDLVFILFPHNCHIYVYLCLNILRSWW